MANMQAETKKSSKDEALDMLQGLLQQAHAELRDANAKVFQSRGQVEDLAQRNAALIGEVRRIEGALEQTPRLSIREVYTSALDVQQRLLTVRAQMERLQAEEEAAQRFVNAIEQVIKTLSVPDKDPRDGKAFNAREMLIKVIDAQEETNENLARSMHDGPAHSLTNFILQAEICAKLFDRNPEKAREELENLKTAANDAFKEVRSFIFDLRPMMLTDLGLVPTIKRYLEAFADKTGIETDFELIGRDRRLGEQYREVLIFRGLQALIQNARDQSGATSISVRLDMSGDTILVAVEDNGRGFSTGRLSLDASNSQALGLGALQERVNLVGGIVRVDSLPGQGAKIEIEIPSGPNNASSV